MLRKDKFSRQCFKKISQTLGDNCNQALENDCKKAFVFQENLDNYQKTPSVLSRGN